jgi:hypothetical protein
LAKPQKSVIHRVEMSHLSNPTMGTAERGVLAKGNDIAYLRMHVQNKMQSSIQSEGERGRES